MCNNSFVFLLFGFSIDYIAIMKFQIRTHFLQHVVFPRRFYCYIMSLFNVYYCPAIHKPNRCLSFCLPAHQSFSLCVYLPVYLPSRHSISTKNSETTCMSTCCILNYFFPCPCTYIHICMLTFLLLMLFFSTLLLLLQHHYWSNYCDFDFFFFFCFLAFSSSFIRSFITSFVFINI